ncbi:MAG: response regulator [Actinomycetota bacterium]|nr:response regulator [Actinomycetota bacterium]MDD5665689.1 response regulator [Actinomycetota bacterium]
MTKTGDTPIKVLVVDDEKNILDIIKFNLEVEGYEVITSRDGEEALRLVRELRPDLILCDIMMPDLDGLEVCRRLKADSRTNQIPVVMLSARTQAQDKVASIEAGADDFITKPFDFSDLVARITINLIRTRQKRDVSPLTGLPGSISIDAETKRRISRNLLFATLYIDMDNFKPFNDIYGFPTGDKAIRMLASIVDDAVKKAGNLDDFIGHGGGDDFVVITSPEKASAIAESVITDFDEQISSLYQEEDLRRGYSIYIDRLGRDNYIPIMTLSIGIASNYRRRITTHWEVGEIAKETLNYAKSIPGSTYFVDRRTK